MSSSSSSSSISRSLSLPRYLKRETCEVENLLLTRLPPPNYQVDDDNTDAAIIAAQAAGNVVAIKRYWIHYDHPLILSTYLKENNESDKCWICKIYFTWGTLFYKCISDSKCGDIIIHKLCAELPRQITNLLHPEHRLDFFYNWHIEDKKCAKCEVDSISNGHTCCGYMCFFCDFVLHVKCALQDTPISVKSSSSLSRSLSFPLHRKQNSPILFSYPPNLPNLKLLISSFSKFQIYKKPAEIRHISHIKHPLFLMTYFQYFWSHDCIICDEKFLKDDLVYGCRECRAFFLHKSCAEIVYPLSIRNMLHLAHLLQLTFFLKTNTAATCNICDKDLSGRIGYNCALCEYILDIECAFTHIFEDHKEHKFKVLFKEFIFTCDACGLTENKKHKSSLCTGCPLQVHQKCSNLFLPTVKQSRHPHTLHLTYFFECDDEFADKMCNICYNKINNVYCVYQCTICTTYITHVTCSTSKGIIEKEIEEKEIMPSSVESTEDMEEGRQVKHFIHPHDLIYSNVNTETDMIICDACVRPISCVPFYKCADNRCSFCLHKQCFELPRKLQHPLHAHPLTLISLCDEEQYFEHHLFCVQCYGCDICCNGFVYGCKECKFWMDVRCSVLSYTLKHDSHACTLSLVDYKRVRDQGIVDKAKCNACGCKCKLHSLCKYTCEPCNFHLDLGCALLPRTVAHDCPRHNWKPNCPLKLRYGAIKDGSGIYFCDMCEEPRGENDWFYYCEDCKWSNHPHCVLGKVQLKYGNIYLLVLAEELRLFKLMKIAERLGYLCGECKKPCKDSTFFCAEEKKSYHIECASSKVIQEEQNDLHLAVRGFLNGIQKIRQSKEDNIRLVRAFLNEIWEIINSEGDYDIRYAVRWFLYGVLEIQSEGDDDTLDAVRAFFNEIGEIQSEGDDDILCAVRKFSNGFRVIMSKDLMALMRGDKGDDLRAF